MRNQLIGGVLLASVMLLGSAVLRGQTTGKPGDAKAQTPAVGADLTGVWKRSARPPDKSRRYTVFQLTMAYSTEEPSLTPWGLEKFKANRPNIGPRAVPLGDSNDPALLCFPPGVPRIYSERAEPLEIFQVSGRVVMVYEYDHFVREIHTDGREHAKDLPASWMGDSVGKWEGSTLVVDTVGFNDKTWLDYEGHPHSEDMHVVERIQRPSHDSMTVDITVDDPKAYAKPWHAHQVYDLKPDWSLGEMVCEDNINFSDMQKKTEAGK